jgi:pimeloyl-ACP methyl ester carboxylesterase
MLQGLGFVVVSVEHPGTTWWDVVEGVAEPLDDETLGVRALDVAAVLRWVETSLGVGSAERLVLVGHSMGVATMMRLLVDFPEIPTPTALIALAAPAVSPVFPSVPMADLRAELPALFVLAGEDNSIQELGNRVLRNNAAMWPAASWLVTYPDAGHWSWTTHAGLWEGHAPGCGEGIRQTDGTAFVYPAPEDVQTSLHHWVRQFLAQEASQTLGQIPAPAPDTLGSEVIVSMP